MNIRTHYSISRALGTIFLEARLPSKAGFHARPSAAPQIILPLQHIRGLHRKRTAPTQRAVRTELWNDEIEAGMIQLIDPETNKLLEPRARWDVLRSFNPKSERLIQVREESDLIAGQRHAVCKIINIKEDLLRQKKSERLLAERRRAEAVSKSVKTLEINWNIDRHDLEYRLARAKEFLQEGRRVDIVLARKRGTKAATEPQCRDLIRIILKSLNDVEGARELKAMEGELGKVTQLWFKGTAQNERSTTQTLPDNSPAAMKDGLENVESTQVQQ